MFVQKYEFLNRIDQVCENSGQDEEKKKQLAREVRPLPNEERSLGTKG